MEVYVDKLIDSVKSFSMYVDEQMEKCSERDVELKDTGNGQSK